MLDKSGRYNTYNPDPHTVVVIPVEKDRARVSHPTAKSAPAARLPVAEIEPERSVQDEMKILSVYAPTKRELDLIRWAKVKFADEPHIAAEVHAVVYRSFTTMRIASTAQHMDVWKKSQELKAGFPKPEFRPKV